MFDTQKQEVLNAALKLDRYGLIALSGGNVSCRMDSGEVLVTPSGMIYDDMVPEDILVVDLDGNIIEGERKASVDTEALLYIYKNMPQVNAVIHTHQPYATGLGLVMDELPCNLSTMANATEGPVAVAEYGDPGSLSMGVEAVKAIGDRLAVVLKHHGVIAVGRDLRQALFSCVYLEEAAKTVSVALSTGMPMATMTQEQIDEAVAVFHRYGQKPIDQDA
ncbi:class II aldolase/adducin family protein [Collinsella sp. Sow4_E3]|uniref:class II aldolase/adducin family protein n=1 Tax=Collinsella sp. Sow4_E3 TaxID=3438776 RepID=UPI0029F784F0|nr:class II aldolase/adducin family protein [Collinsella sp.]MCI6219359.1 class II aldolase/adducin family protein [Collinsella sp.]MCI7312222.1 class II aldolase/adducin family protein [Collinsella sp.]MCI7409071.1 class II aldolase/adducin family protein [Collinsella sp.]MDD6556068.1 class II aldolase/adducin family protein [Collinsella sp.]